MITERLINLAVEMMWEVALLFTEGWAGCAPAISPNSKGKRIGMCQQNQNTREICA